MIPVGSVPVLERMTGIRIVATPTSLDTLSSESSVHLRIAPDEMLIIPACPGVTDNLKDPHAIVIQETSFFGAWFSHSQVQQLFASYCEWPYPPNPGTHQGAMANIPIKLFQSSEESLLLVQSPYLADFLERVE